MFPQGYDGLNHRNPGETASGTH